MKWSRIENDVVMEIIDFNPEGIFSQELTFVKCPDYVEQNWTYKNEKFIVPVKEEVPEAIPLSKEKIMSEINAMNVRLQELIRMLNSH